MARKATADKPEEVDHGAAVLVDYFLSSLFCYTPYGFGPDPGWAVTRYIRFEDDTTDSREIARFTDKAHAESFLLRVRGGC